MTARLGTREVTRLVQEVCDDALQKYVRWPWRWPKESDLVVDLVHSLNRELGRQAVALADLVGPGSLDLSTARARVPRVRTEARPRTESRTAFDIAILGTTPLEVHLHANGARDVVRRVDGRQIAALIEVKLEPGLTQQGWVADLEKLMHPQCEGTRVVLWIDTSLPLKAVGVTYEDATAVVRRTENCEYAWPLQQNRSMKIGGTLLALAPARGPRSGGVSLAALGLSPRTRPVDFETLLSPDAVAPCWWQVTSS